MSLGFMMHASSVWLMAVPYVKWTRFMRPYFPVYVSININFQLNADLTEYEKLVTTRQLVTRDLPKEREFIYFLLTVKSFSNNFFQYFIGFTKNSQTQKI